MYITHNHISRLFPQSKGMNKKELRFEAISFSSKVKQPNGKFVPLFQTEIEESYENDTIATLSDGREPLPLLVFRVLDAAIRFVEKYGVQYIGYRTKAILMDYRKPCKEKNVIPSAANQKQLIMLLDEWKGRV